jgi:hypothetical protein
MCPRCSKLAAKRFCPALNQKICAPCCARDRMLYIGCPESCHYLKAGRESSLERSREFRLRYYGQTGKTFPKLTKEMADFLYFVELRIVMAQREQIRDLEDRDILEAVETLIKNLQTEHIIYEHRALSERAQQLSRRLRADIESIGLPRADMIDALSSLCDLIRAYVERSNDPQAYLRGTAILFPWERSDRDKLILQV